MSLDDTQIINTMQLWWDINDTVDPPQTVRLTPREVEVIEVLRDELSDN